VGDVAHPLGQQYRYPPFLMSELTDYDILKSKFVRHARSAKPDTQNWAILDGHVDIQTKTHESVCLYPASLTHGDQQFELKEIRLYWMETQRVNSPNYVPHEDPQEFKRQNYGNVILKYGMFHRKEYRINGLQQAVFPLMSYINWLQKRT